jgi:hypothetical protein
VTIQAATSSSIAEDISDADMCGVFFFESKKTGTLPE